MGAVSETPPLGKARPPPPPPPPLSCHLGGDLGPGRGERWHAHGPFLVPGALTPQDLAADGTGAGRRRHCARRAAAGGGWTRWPPSRHVACPRRLPLPGSGLSSKRLKHASRAAQSTAALRGRTSPRHRRVAKAARGQVAFPPPASQEAAPAHPSPRRAGRSWPRPFRCRDPHPPTYDATGGWTWRDPASSRQSAATSSQRPRLVPRAVTWPRGSGGSSPGVGRAGPPEAARSVLPASPSPWPRAAPFGLCRLPVSVTGLGTPPQHDPIVTHQVCGAAVS